MSSSSGSYFAALTQDLTARYTLGPLLGQGAFGAVHRARDVAAGRDVALKLLNLERTEVAVSRFLREANVVAGLEHPGVIRVHAAGRHGARPAIVYELVEGSTFSAAARTLAPRARAELVRDAARAVGHAHARGVVHRDLKPDNLLVGHDGRLHVADFGLALCDGADRLTRTGGFVGTPHYMAPELFGTRAREGAGPAADVWALGVILYEALTGRLPFDAPDLVGLMAQLEQGRVTPPRRIDPLVDPALEAVCLRALERDLARRFPDGDALAQAIDDALSGALRARRPRAVPLGLAAAGLALAGVVTALALRGPAPASTPERPTVTEAQAVAPTPAPPVVVPDVPVTDRQLLRSDTPRWAVWADARRVVTGGADDAIRLWDASTGQELRSWSRPGSVAAARLEPGRVIVGSTAGLHALATDGDAPPSPFGRFVSVTEVACAAGSGHVAVIGRTASDTSDCVYRMTSSGDDRRAAPLPDDGRIPVAIALSHDGSLLAVSTDDGAGSTFAPGGAVLLFSAERGQPALRSRTALPGVGTALRFHQERVAIVGASTAQLGKINEQGTIIEHFVTKDSNRAHLGVVRAVALSADGARVFSAAEVPAGLELLGWTYRACEAVGAPFTAPGQPLTLDLSPDGRALVIGTRTGGVLVRVVD